MSTGNKHDSGAAQCARRRLRRWAVVLELPRGADLEATSRTLRVTIRKGVNTIYDAFSCVVKLFRPDKLRC